MTGGRPRRRRLTLRARLALWYGGAVALAGVLLVAVTTVAATAAVLTSPDAAEKQAAQTAQQLLVVLDSSPAPPRESASPRASATPGSSPSSLPSPPVQGGDVVSGTTDLTSSEQYASLRDAVAAENARIQSEVLHAVFGWSIAALALVVVVAVFLGWFIASRALAPLRLMAATAHRVAGDNLGERLALDGPDDEVKDLADTFDAMLERLDRSFDAQRRFVANASHELRTPLTINRTVLEVALADPQASADLREVGRSLLDVNARHERLIEGLLTLASADGDPELPDEVDLADAVETAVARAVAAGAGIAPAGPAGELSAGEPSAPGASPGGPRLHLDLSRGLLVRGNELLAERLAQNLVDNAVRYNVPGGSVWVRLSREDADAVLVVENTGPAVPPEEAASLFEPFRRLNSSGRPSDRSAGYVKGGLGLGLSIVRSVAHAHAGTVTATSRTDGGLRVEVRLPLIGSAADGESSG